MSMSDIVTFRNIVRVAVAGSALLTIMLISFTATLVPEVFTFARGLPLGDKAGHFLLFGAATFVVVAAFPGRKRTKLFVAGVVACYVVLDEFFQIFAPTRDFELLDMFANLSGVATFALVALIAFRKKQPAKLVTGKIAHS